MWFQIKAKDSLLYRPRHVLTHLHLRKLQSLREQVILMPSSWYAHSGGNPPKNVEDQDEKYFAVDKVLKICGKEEFGKKRLDIGSFPNSIQKQMQKNFRI